MGTRNSLGGGKRGAEWAGGGPGGVASEPKLSWGMSPLGRFRRGLRTMQKFSRYQRSEVLQLSTPCRVARFASKHKHSVSGQPGSRVGDGLKTLKRTERSPRRPPGPGAPHRVCESAARGTSGIWSPLLGGKGTWELFLTKLPKARPQGSHSYLLLCWPARGPAGPHLLAPASMKGLKTCGNLVSST